MKGGHNKLPRAVKELRGTLKKARENPMAPHVGTGPVPPPPPALSPAEREVWLELAPQVESLRVFAPSHVTAFRLCVEAVAATRGDEARAMAPTARVRLMQVAAGLLSRFGLDPASQDRVSAAPKETVDQVEDFLFGGPKLVEVPEGDE